MNIDISVIIVNYNAGNSLIECVRSLTDPHIEIIISDNGSHDNSLSLLQQEFANDPRLIIIENHANLGFSRGNNVALAKARGKYLLFLNPDCIVKAGALMRMQQVMQENPTAGMAGCLIRNVDGSVQGTCVRGMPTPWNSLARVLHLKKIFPKAKFLQGVDLADVALPNKITEVTGISGAFMFVRRPALETVGLLDENYFLYVEDLDWMMRFHLANWKILFVPDAETVHIKGVCGKKTPYKVVWHKHKGMMRFYQKFFRNKYPLVLMGLVYLGIWIRFLAMICWEVFKKTSENLFSKHKRIIQP